jgi:hypothetical protein
MTDNTTAMGATIGGDVIYEAAPKPIGRIPMLEGQNAVKEREAMERRIAELTDDADIAAGLAESQAAVIAGQAQRIEQMNVSSRAAAVQLGELIDRETLKDDAIRLAMEWLLAHALNDHGVYDRLNEALAVKP